MESAPGSAALTCAGPDGIMDHSSHPPEFGKTMNWIFWSLLSAFFAGVTAILAKLGVAGVNSNLATAIRTLVILIFSWAIALATSPTGALRNLAPRTWTFLVLSGLATGLSWLCYFRALQLGEASRVGSYR